MRQLNALVTRAITIPQLQNVWVVAELSDVRQSAGHCYMELLDKNPDTGAVESKMKGIIWAGTFSRLSAQFLASTGQRFSSGLKVMVCGTVNYHASFGMSFIISAVDASYTLGEAERLRRQILERLKAEGVIDLNRRLVMPAVPLRVAVISAKGAAGYGDFINQLYNNRRHLRFTTRLFPALLQGDRAAASIIAALDEVASQADQWDCVVIIRGGGATADLSAFDNYDLANNVAQFPLPVIVGIGHERDVTVLDYIACLRVKTPTAAAEWLVAQGSAALDNLHNLCSDIVAAAQERISGAQTRLAYIDGLLPVAPLAAVERASSRLTSRASQIGVAASGRIVAALSRLDSRVETLSIASRHTLTLAANRLDATSRLVDALSPQATLRRGYSMTLVDGHAVRSIDSITPGQSVETILADGSFTSVINQTNGK